MSNASPANVTNLCRAVLQWGRGVVGHAYDDGRYDDGPHNMAAEFIVQNLRRLDCDLAPCWSAILASKPSLDRLRDEPVTAGDESAPSAHELAYKLACHAWGIGTAAIRAAWGVPLDEVRDSLAAWSDLLTPAISALGQENADIGAERASADVKERRPALVAFREAEEVRNARLHRLREAVRKRLDNGWLSTELSYAACQRLDAMIQGEAARLIPLAGSKTEPQPHGHATPPNRYDDLRAAIRAASLIGVEAQLVNAIIDHNGQLSIENADLTISGDAMSAYKRVRPKLLKRGWLLREHDRHLCAEPVPRKQGAK